MNTLAVFDIDETMFATFSKIIVRDKITGKEITQLSNTEYNTYKLKDNEEFDYSQFSDSSLFKNTSQVIDASLKRVKQEFADRDTMIVFLTARSNFDSNKEFKNVFRSHGIKVNDKRIRFELAGNLKYGTIPERKDYVIRKFIKQFKPNVIKMFDDFIENINILNGIGKDYPFIRLEKYLIKNRSIIPLGTVNENVMSFQTFKESLMSFKNYINEEKNTHMMHIENAILYTGVKGTEKAITALEDLASSLSGKESGGQTVTQKWDGAPAIICGPDPDTGEFFVAKKGIFNKDPKVYKSVADIKADTSGDLANKLIAAYTHLKPIGLKTILQGDLMFTQSDLSEEKIDGKKYITFQPNTIVYAVSTDSDFGKRLKSYKLGIVFHTEYVGNSYQTLSANYNIDISKYKNNKNVWIDDAYVKDLSGVALLSSEDSNTVISELQNARNIFAKVNKSTLKEIEDDQELARDIETFQNTFIRSGIEVLNTSKHVKDLVQWYQERFAKEREARKSEKGKEAITAKEKNRMSFFSRQNTTQLKLLFDLQRSMIIAKTILFRQLDKLNSIGTFVRTNDGFQVTGSEGFVVIDKIGGKAYKIVDRLEFSKNNFSKNIIKSWQR